MKFRMDDGTFVDAPNYAGARAQWQAARAPKPPGPVHQPAARVVDPTVTPVLTPDDNFSGRSPIRFGIGEKITLGFTSNPPGRTAASFGGLQWVVVSGPAEVKNDPGNVGTGRLICGGLAGAVVLELRTTTVPGTAKAKKRLEVVRPTDAVMERFPGTLTFHRKGKASAGFLGMIFLRPADVSFGNTEFREGAAPYEATGCFKMAEVELDEIEDVIHPVRGKWSTVSRGSAKGSAVNTPDRVRSHTLSPPFTEGTFTWNIPWLCRVKGGGDEFRIAVATHHHSVDAAGTMTITKKGVTVRHEATDDTKNF